MKFLMANAWRRAVLVWLGLLVLVLVVVAMEYRKLHQEAEQALLQDERENAQNARAALNFRFGWVARDGYFLSTLPVLEHLHPKDGQAMRQMLSGVLGNFLQTRLDLYQAAGFLDSDGREVLRVQQRGDGVVVWGQ